MKRLLITSAFVAALSTSSAAQRTSYAPFAARLPASARTLAMGDIGVAGRDDDVLFYNPAQLFVARGTSMSAERMSKEARGGTMSTVLRIGPGGLGIGVNYLEYRATLTDYPLTRDDILGSAPTVPSATSTLVSVGYAQTIKTLRIGVSANYATDEIGIDRFRNILGDVGLARDFSRFTVGLALQHLGEAMEVNPPPPPLAPQTINPALLSGRIKPPMKATLGAAWSGPAGPLDLVGTVAVSGMREGHLSPGVGGEASYSWLSGYAISFRSGVRYPHQIGDATLTSGVGFVADRLSLDVAAEFLKASRIAYRVGLRVR